MPRELNRLTAVAIRNSKPHEGGTGPKLHADGGGLYLQVMPSLSKSWLFRYAFQGKAKAMGLGPLHEVSLAEAREEASRLRKVLKDGLDPQIERLKKAAKQRDSQRRTFKACAEEFMRKIEGELRNEKHRAQWKTSLERYAYPIIGELPVNDIDVHMIRKILTQDNVWSEKTETISRVRGRIERVLGWATVLGYRSGENPARWRSFLSEVLPSKKAVQKVRHHPAVPYQELPDFFVQLRAQAHSAPRAALEFLTLTAARTGEVIGATWAEIDEQAKIWTIPASRMKAGRIHRVPLSSAALEALQSIKKYAEKGFIFRGMKLGKHISNMSMLQLMRRMKAEAVPHGMRSCFRDYIAEKTSYPRELAEAALAHVLESKTEAAYQRGDLLERRRVMMDEWAAHCLSKVVASSDGQLEKTAILAK
jgi:integrase